MKFIRSSKLYFSKHITQKKQSEIDALLSEYARVVNYFILTYETSIPHERVFDLVKSDQIHRCMLDTNTWLSYSNVNNAFREGYCMVKASRAKTGEYHRPVHRGIKATLASPNNKQCNSTTALFDFNVTLCSLKPRGHNYSISIPLKKHKHFVKWDCVGDRSKSITLTKNYIQFSFKVESGKKKDHDEQHQLGIDVGLNSLFTTSDGHHFGANVRDLIESLNRKKRCSAAWYKQKRHIKHYIDTELNKIDFKNTSLIVVEKLKNLKKNMKVKRRLTKNIRRVITHWCYRYILTRIESLCEENRVVFRSVNPKYTSTTCNQCGHSDKKNRLSQSIFQCQQCGHADNADVNASRNILERFISGHCHAGYTVSIN